MKSISSSLIPVNSFNFFGIVSFCKSTIQTLSIFNDGFSLLLNADVNIDNLLLTIELLLYSLRNFMGLFLIF